MIEIRHPGWENSPIVLDFRDPEHPSRQDNIKACPGPWNDRAAALLEVSRNLRKLGKALEAQADRNDAWEDCLQLIEGRFAPSKLPGVLHCFTGEWQHAKTALGFGFYISFAGNVTYPKAENIRAASRTVRVIGPAWSSEEAKATMPQREQRP